MKRLNSVTFQCIMLILLIGSTCWLVYENVNLYYAQSELREAQKENIEAQRRLVNVLKEYNETMRIIRDVHKEISQGDVEDEEAY